MYVKNIIRRSCFLFVIIALLFSSAPGALAAVPQQLAEYDYENVADCAGEKIDISVETADCFTETVLTADNYDSLVRAVAEQYLERDNYFEIRYNADKNAVYAITNDYDDFFDDIFSYDFPETTSDLDYLEANMRSLHIGGTMYSTYTVFEFTQTYDTTYQEETYVDAAVDAILNSLNVYESSQYKKIKAIHDYIVQHVEYDDSLVDYTAYDALYDGLTTCNGYSLLAYKMFLEAGVPSRRLTGIGVTGSGSGYHGWNIVEIGTYWYNLDVTWDDTARTTAYFLKNDASFSDHIRDAEYKTALFYAQYPMSPNNFNLNNDVTLVSSITFSSASGEYEIGDVVSLSPTVRPSGATNKTLSWSTSDKTVASVDANGHVTINGSGMAVITAAASDGSGKTAGYFITAYETLPPSTWAEADIASLEARGVIPEEINGGYKDSITRAEFTALMVNVCEYATGSPYEPVNELPFTDISDSIYQAQILKGYTLGIINGLGNDLFGPDHTLTREQCAKIISITAGIVNEDETVSEADLPFSDAASIRDWALPYVRYAYENGLMNGTGVNFEPQGTLPREQAMVIAERMIEKYGW